MGEAIETDASGNKTIIIVPDTDNPYIFILEYIVKLIVISIILRKLVSGMDIKTSIMGAVGIHYIYTLLIAGVILPVIIPIIGLVILTKLNPGINLPKVAGNVLAGAGLYISVGAILFVLVMAFGSR